MAQGPWTTDNIRSVSDQITQLRAVTNSDSEDLPISPAKALYTGAGGDITVIAAGDTAAVLLPNTAPGIWMPIMVTRVLSTGTSPTDTVAGY